MAETWEIRASTARNIANNAPLRKLKKAKKQICEEIITAARCGDRNVIILFEYYEVSCLEDWCNIYNWLKKLGYEVEDNSGRKMKPCFIIHW